MAKARVTTDRRNGRVVVDAYAGVDPETRRPRTRPRETLPPGAPDAEVAAACARVEERAAFMMATGEDMTLDGLVSWYLGELARANRPPGTVKTYRSYYFRHISPRRGRTAAGAVRPFMVSRDLDAAVRGADRAPISPRTANCIRSLLHAAYAAGMAEGIVERNPVAAVMRLDEDRCDGARVFDEGEMAVLIGWIGSPSATWVEECAKAAASLALDTGLRVGETVALRRRDFNRRTLTLAVAGTVTEAGGLHRKAPKGKRARFVALGEDQAERIEAWGARSAEFAGSSGLLFPDERGGLLRPSAVSREFGEACARLGLGEGRRFHELRHTHATWLLEQGASPKTVAERIGDAGDAFVLSTYGHALPGRDRAAAESFGRMREEVNNPGKEGERTWPRG